MSQSIANRDLPLGMEVRHLVALEAIGRTRSFSRAAEELGYAQSAVSQQIATLERAVGHRLIERPGGPRPVSLTEAGTLLLRHASHLAARLGAVKADLDALAAGEAGAVRVGTFQSASARLLPPTLARFRDGWPRIGVELRNEMDCGNLDGLVLAGQLDLAFSDVTTLDEALDAAELIVDPYVLMVPPSSPLAELDEADLGALGDEHLISSSFYDSCAMRVDRAFGAVRRRPETIFRSDDNLTSQRLVAAGLGIALVPLLTVELHVPDAEVVVLPLVEDQSFSRRIGLVWHRDRYRSRAAEAFTETAREVAGTLEVPALPALTART